MNEHLARKVSNKDRAQSGKDPLTGQKGGGRWAVGSSGQ